MTVEELIYQLQDVPPDLVVWHDGGGDPYCAGEVSRVDVLSLATASPPGTVLMGSLRPLRWVELS